MNISGVLLNALLDYCMIFGWGRFRNGIAGAAVATNLSTCFCVLIYVCLLLRPAVEHEYHFLKSWKPDLRLFQRLMRYGLPSGYNLFIDIAGFTAFIMLIGLFGRKELAATNIAFNLNTLAFIPVLGHEHCRLHACRAADRRRPAGCRGEVGPKGFVISGGYMLMFGLIYVLLPDLLTRPYALRANPADAVPFSEIHNLVVVLLRFVALYSFFDAMAIIFGSAVRAAGDTVFSMLFTLVSSMSLLVLPTFVTWLNYRNDPNLIWWSWVFCSVYVITLGVGFYLRFLQGKWKTMRVIEPAPDDLDVSDALTDVASVGIFQAESAAIDG